MSQSDHPRSRVHARALSYFKAGLDIEACWLRAAAEVKAEQVARGVVELETPGRVWTPANRKRVA
jgi:hypothetical protein